MEGEVHLEGSLPVGIRELATGLEHSTTLTKLYLKALDLDAVGVSELVVVLRSWLGRNRTLKLFVMADVSVGADEARQFAALWRRTKPFLVLAS